MLSGCLVCVICDTSSFHSSIFKTLYVMIALTLNMCAPYILCTFDNILGLLNLDIITFTSSLECLHCFLCVICNSNRFHSFIFKLCILIVHTLKMCSDKAGPEQSLVLFYSCFFGFSFGRHCTFFCLFDLILYVHSTIFQLCGTVFLG